MLRAAVRQGHEPVGPVAPSAACPAPAADAADAAAGLAPRVPRAEVLRASPPMFRSPALDRLTRVRPFVPPLLYVPAIAALLTVAVRAGLGAGTTAGAFAGGWAAWTLLEYWIHRAIFHLEPRGRLGARLHWMVHGVHHDHPSDPLRQMLPPVVSLPLAALFLGLYVAVLGLPLAWAFDAGFVAGYLAYDLLHCALHRRRPRSRLGRHLHELHMRHHFEDDNRGFGVSAPFWDVVFGTYSRSARRGRRPSAS